MSEPQHVRVCKLKMRSHDNIDQIVTMDQILWVQDKETDYAC
jgi:hypothetical protein